MEIRSRQGGVLLPFENQNQFRCNLKNDFTYESSTGPSRSEYSIKGSIDQDPTCGTEEEGRFFESNKKELWQHPRQPGSTTINWKIKDGIWEVKPAASNDKPDGDTSWIQNPATGEARNLNTIGTKAKFSDFTMTFDFRCPYMRDVWNSCDGNALKSPQNWGNSGIKILDLNGYELQILDSHGAELKGKDVGNGYFETSLGSCETGSGTPKANVVYNKQVCGAIYHFMAPSDIGSFPAVAKNDNKKNRAPAPKSVWTPVRIDFMSARYQQIRGKGECASWQKVLCSTIKVSIAGKEIHSRLGMDLTGRYKECSSMVHDTFYDTDTKTRNWCKAHGPIFIQEHDSKVQFRKIKIMPNRLNSRNFQVGVNDRRATCVSRVNPPKRK